MALQKLKAEFVEILTPLYGAGEAAALTRIVFEDIGGIKLDGSFAGNDKVLTENSRLQIRAALQRLLSGEPVQYITGFSFFLGHKIFVDRSVLIPRPETEELALTVIEFAKNIESPKILDIGTGSGCIAIALKKALPRSEVWAVDMSGQALNTAMKNAAVAHAHIRFVAADILSNESMPAEKFDLIVSNPPYIPLKEKELLEKNVTEWEPKTALFVPDDDPLLFYRAITKYATGHLSKSGALFFELHENFAKQTSELVKGLGFSAELRNDMQGKQRMLIATPCP